jgi:FlaA1/EpsC-like NDP-sugar epimerase
MKKTIITAAVIFFLDAFILNQGVVAGLMLLIVVFVFLPKAIYRQIKNREYKPVYIKCLIYGSTAFLIFGSNYLNNVIAHNRSVMLITTIEQYKSENGEYPENLEALVPKYIEAVPTAKFSLMNEFWYHKQNGDASLFYVAFPPFGRPIYYFSKKEWGYMD